MKNEYMNLSFYQMWYFICAMELGSYSKASQKLNVTQSAISKTIQNIEQNLQVQLFAREKNILVPNGSRKKPVSFMERCDQRNAGICGSGTQTYGR